jgi:hypothetical protein
VGLPQNNQTKITLDNKSFFVDLPEPDPSIIEAMMESRVASLPSQTFRVSTPKSKTSHFTASHTGELSFKIPLPTTEDWLLDRKPEQGFYNEFLSTPHIDPKEWAEQFSTIRGDTSAWASRSEAVEVARYLGPHHSDFNHGGYYLVRSQPESFTYRVGERLEPFCYEDFVDKFTERQGIKSSGYIKLPEGCYRYEILAPSGLVELTETTTGDQENLSLTSFMRKLR